MRTVLGGRIGRIVAQGLEHDARMQGGLLPRDREGRGRLLADPAESGSGRICRGERAAPTWALTGGELSGEVEVLPTTRTTRTQIGRRRNEDAEQGVRGGKGHLRELAGGVAQGEQHDDQAWGNLTAEPRGVACSETDAAGCGDVAGVEAGAEDRALSCMHGGDFAGGSIYSHR
jgi:hypothetical protein